MELTAPELLAMLILPLLHVVRTATERILSCDVTALEPCADSQQVCNATTLSCQCLPGLQLVDGRCVAGQPPSGPAGAGWAVAAVLVAGSLLGLAVALAARRYGLWARLLQRLRPPAPRYEDVMIGADDPPLSL